MNIRGFLRWQFAGTLNNLSFWGLMLGMLGGLAAISGCPRIGPMLLFIIAAGLILFDALRSYFRFSYSIYEMEQRRIINELERKERGNP